MELERNGAPSHGKETGGKRVGAKASSGRNNGMLTFPKERTMKAPSRDRVQVRVPNYIDGGDSALPTLDPIWRIWELSLRRTQVDPRLNTLNVTRLTFLPQRCRALGAEVLDYLQLAVFGRNVQRTKPVLVLYLKSFRALVTEVLDHLQLRLSGRNVQR